MLHILTWWLILQVLGWAALPLAYQLFKWLPGRGYTFAKPLGLLLVSYTFWILTSLGFLRNTWAGIVFAILVVAAVGGWFYAAAPGRDTTGAHDPGQKKSNGPGAHTYVEDTGPEPCNRR